jgi:hypothetical protein
MSDCPLSEAALHGLDEAVQEAELGTSTPARLLDDALDYLSIQGEISPDEDQLKAEVGAMPPEARESLSRAIAAARRKERICLPSRRTADNPVRHN